MELVKDMDLLVMIILIVPMLPSIKWMGSFYQEDKLGYSTASKKIQKEKNMVVLQKDYWQKIDQPQPYLKCQLLWSMRL